MEKFIIYILFAVVSFSSFGQYSFDKEKEKYWVYRERVKNFVVSGNCQGSGIPTNSRGINDVMSWADAPWNIGYWIATLAVEYDILKKAGADLCPRRVSCQGTLRNYFDKHYSYC